MFVFYPVITILVSALQNNDGAFAPGEFFAKFFDRSVWGLDCVTSHLRCGVAWNTLFLAVLVGIGTTALGLAFALIATRTNMRLKGTLRVLTILPIITPPFVIGLALILLFGRSGTVTALLSNWFGIPPSRWIYGLPGILIAQLLAFTPIAFLVLIGVVQGISPSLEEAAQTLRARRWTRVRTVSLPLMRPGLANAFLLGFVESMADFGNPLVLGGNFDVLSTEDLLRRGRRRARPGARRRAVDHPAGLHAGRLLGAARLARQARLHHGDRQGRCRHPLRAAARIAWLCC